MVIKRKPFIRVLVVITIVLAIWHILLVNLLEFSDIDYFRKLRRFFHLNWEISFASYFSSAILGISAFLLFITGESAKENRRQWKLLAIIFFFLSLDEALAFHEELVDPLRAIIGLIPWLYHAWLIVAIPILIGLAIFFRRFLLSLPRKTLRRFILAAFFFLGGAIGMETIAGYYEYTFQVETDYTLNMFILVEEVMEMTGVILFINAIILHADSKEQEITFEITS